MTAESARMNRLTLRFADAGLEKAFTEEQARKSLRPIRIALVCAGAPVLVLWPAIDQITPSFQEQMPRIVAFREMT